MEVYNDNHWHLVQYLVCSVQGIVRLEKSCEVSPHTSNNMSLAVLALVLTVASGATGKVSLVFQ